MRHCNLRFQAFLCSLFLSVLLVYPQQGEAYAGFTNQQLGSIYYAYPAPTAVQTPAPKGYEPFYISHYGRHGSRRMETEEPYRKAIQVFETHELTPLGEDVKQRLYKVLAEAQGRFGDLTSTGVRQHRQIAERMYRNFPQVFKGDVSISARSSTVTRCIMSMAAFCERLKELNPSLQIEKEANKRYMDYLSYTSPEGEKFVADNAPWRKECLQFEIKHVRPQRFLAALFQHPDEIQEPYATMEGLYWIAANMQDVEIGISFYDIFEKKELFDIWQLINYRMYVGNANFPLGKGVMPRCATSLLRNIVGSADQAIASGKPGASLRFGHDGTLIRLLALMKIEEFAQQETLPEKYYLAWQDFKAAPMAGNLQLVFFKNKAGEVIVKFLHNEAEVRLPIASPIAPYYKWMDVKAFYKDLLVEN